MNTIKTLIEGMRKLREAATAGPWKGQTNAIVGAHNELVFDSTINFAYPIKKHDRDFIAAAPTNQERMEKSLGIAVEALEKIELSHYEDCDYWEEEDEEADCNCGSYKRRQIALTAIEAALRGEK